ncbi:hypothetical protein C8R43DRAFT_1055353 [Mycena crocata]|nr:hypothetical protein C8R43DRAFT_1055353 [Mycena crocata]
MASPPSTDSMNIRPPPTDYSSLDQVQSRLRVKPRFHFLHAHRTAKSPPNTSVTALPLAAPETVIDIDLLSAACAVPDDQDEYRWAIVYENQRGLKIFSTLYYSAFSLLPTDPSPFTTPHPSSRRSKQPDVSLALYPLPDGAWRWLSPWMIDMRSDSGEVQHDGFEYNFIFRTHKWHPEAGAMSWVRRRRWIRLMMRPAKPKHPRKADSLTPNTPNTPAVSIAHNRYSIASSMPPSVFDSQMENGSFTDVEAEELWQSDDPEINWERCRLAMRRAGRDGRILELWRQWLGDEPKPEDKKGKRKQWTEDNDPPSTITEFASVPHAPPPITNILPALRGHGDAILHSFIYPESRARFIQMLERVGVLAELNSDLGVGVSSSEVQFWSYLKEGEKSLIPAESLVKRI